MGLFWADLLLLEVLLSTCWTYEPGSKTGIMLLVLGLAVANVSNGEVTSYGPSVCILQ